MDSNSKTKQSNWFEKHQKLTISFTLAMLIVIIIIIIELILRHVIGLGNPVLYQSSPLLGYRPQPNQTVERLSGTIVMINNLGLRALSDWDEDKTNKVLILGNSVTYGGSYIANDELFSHLATGKSGFLGGNAGVNGWGIDNIHALLVDYEFLPANTYVFVFQEMDFVRGLARLSGKPFWCHKPAFAILELLNFFCYNQLIKMYEGHDQFVTDLEKEKTIEKAVMKLLEIIDFLNAHGYSYLLYISPNRYQVLNDEPVEPVTYKYLQKYQIKIDYIKNRPELKHLYLKDKNRIFFDYSHLTKYGHKVWGKIIYNYLNNTILDFDIE